MYYNFMFLKLHALLRNYILVNSSLRYDSLTARDSYCSIHDLCHFAVKGSHLKCLIVTGIPVSFCSERTILILSTHTAPPTSNDFIVHECQSQGLGTINLTQ